MLFATYRMQFRKGCRNFQLKFHKNLEKSSFLSESEFQPKSFSIEVKYIFDKPAEIFPSRTQMAFFQCFQIFLISVKSAFVANMYTAHVNGAFDKRATFLSTEIRTFHSNSEINFSSSGFSQPNWHSGHVRSSFHHVDENLTLKQLALKNQEKCIFLAPNSLNVPLTTEKLPKPFEISFQPQFFSVHTKCSSWQLHWNVSVQNQRKKIFLWEPQRNIFFIQKTILPTKFCGQLEYSIHHPAENLPLKVWRCFDQSKKTIFWITLQICFQRNNSWRHEKINFVPNFFLAQSSKFFNQLLQKFYFAGSCETIS